MRSPPELSRRATIPDDGPNALVSHTDLVTHQPELPESERAPAHTHPGNVATNTFHIVGIAGTSARVAIEGPLLIGRGPYNHIVLDDSHISWQHARLVPSRGGLLLHDLNSTNGTTVNGAHVTRHRLEPNDTIGFGRFVFRIEQDAPVAPKGPPSGWARTREADTQAKLRTATPIDLEAFDTIGEMEKSDLHVQLNADGDLEIDIELPLETRESPVADLRQPAVDLRQLEDAYKKLGALYSFVQAISQSTNTRELLELVTSRLREAYPLARAIRIFLRDLSESDGTPSAAVPSAPVFVLAQDDAAAAWSADRLDPTLQELVTGSGRTVVHEGRVVAPMLDRGEMVGVIELEVDAVPSRSGLDLLDGMAAPAAMHLQNSRMREARAKRERLDHDLQLAAEIQRSFLPREVISVEGLDLFVEYRSAYAVGGDFYDVFWVGPGRLGVFVGDISGKGVSAALHMARISSELRSAALLHVEPHAVFAATNNAVAARGQSELFFTAIYFTLDVDTGAIVLANAGHPTPYVKRANGLTEAITTGASGAVGMFDDATFGETRLHLGHGDGLVLYTDGITEALDQRGVMYGDQRLHAALTTAPPRATDLADQVLSGVDRHARGVAVNDDLTLFVCQRRIDRTRSMQPRRRGSGSLARH